MSPYPTYINRSNFPWSDVDECTLVVTVRTHKPHLSSPYARAKSKLNRTYKACVGKYKSLCVSGKADEIWQNFLDNHPEYDGPNTLQERV